MSRYAENTSVPADRSRSEIEKILMRYGATGFMYGWQQDAAVVAFDAKGRRVRFILPMPAKNDAQFTKTPTGRVRHDPQAAIIAWEQATRQRWRALALVVKAKLEAVESGVSSFEAEFLSFILLPNGETVGDFIGPQIDEAYKTGRMPPLLVAHGKGRTDS